MSDPHVYPEAPNAPLSLPAASGIPSPNFASIEQLAASDPSTPWTPKTMFIRVAMSGAACPGVTSATAPNFYLRADGGDDVLINDHTQPPNQTCPIFRRPGSDPIHYIGDGSAFLESHNVFRLVITFNDGAGDYAWQLGIWNNDVSAARQFTWVVSDTLAGTSQPWVHATYRDAVPAHIKFDALPGQTSTDTAQPIEITNRGTGPVTVTGVSPPIVELFTIAGLPATLHPNPVAPATVMIGFNATTPGDIPAKTFTFTTTDKPDPGPFGDGHNVQFILSAHTAAHNTWVAKAPMSTARYWLGLATANNGKIYAVGGMRESGEVATVEEYDPTIDRWTTKAPMPTARFGLGLAAAINGRLYAVGGYNGTDFATVEEYDPANNTWTTKARMPTPRMELGLATASNGRIYAIGGFRHQEASLALDTVEEYDPTADRWETRAPMPTARYSLGVATASNGKIYAAGGFRKESSEDFTGHYFNTLEEYDPATDRWTTKSPMPTARNGLGLAAASNGRVYAVGGYAYGPSAVWFATVEEYDPATNTWTTRAPMPTARIMLALAAARNGKLYAVGGKVPPFNESATVIEFAP
jgi:N-acetylneuraminic acid mutarotase